MTLFLGMLLDALLGEPKWLWNRMPHPAVLMGKAIAWCDDRHNNGENRKQTGILVMAGLGLGALFLGWVISIVPGNWLDVLVIAILLAQKSLVEHVKAVGDALRLSLGDGRRSVAMIVGRDTKDMDAPAVARSAIESAAENLSDGVIAPVFWTVVGGLPGLLLYKITNTADSMIGYRTPKYEQFGWAAARFDDLLNLIPARLTALLIWAVTGCQDAKAVIAEAPKHRSPNAGWPEAAMAYGLKIALSGPRSYDGKINDYPYVNEQGKKILSSDDIDAAVRILWLTWAAALLTVGAIALV